MHKTIQKLNDRIATTIDMNRQYHTANQNLAQQLQLQVAANRNNTNRISDLMHILDCMAARLKSANISVHVPPRPPNTWRQARVNARVMAHIDNARKQREKTPTP